MTLFTNFSGKNILKLLLIMIQLIFVVVVVVFSFSYRQGCGFYVVKKKIQKA